jgi:hypothetical protein
VSAENPFADWEFSHGHFWVVVRTLPDGQLLTQVKGKPTFRDTDRVARAVAEAEAQVRGHLQALHNSLLYGLRKDLQGVAQERGLAFEVLAKNEVDGGWTGILNALDPESPHAVKTEEEARRWHAEGIAYLDEVARLEEEGWPARDFKKNPLQHLSYEEAMGEDEDFPDLEPD